MKNYSMKLRRMSLILMLCVKILVSFRPDYNNDLIRFEEDIVLTELSYLPISNAQDS